MTSGEYRNLLRKKIRNVGEWMIDHADDMVMDIPGITSLKINICLADDDVPLADNITIEQKNVTCLEKVK